MSADVYAVIRTGGKQHRISPGQRLRVERLPGEVGDSITFQDVLMVSDGAEVAVGSPVLDAASVTAEVVDQTRGRKINVFKYKAKTRYRRLRGHRQLHTDLRISQISLGEQTWDAPQRDAAVAEAAPEDEPQALEEDLPEEQEEQPAADEDGGKE